MKNIIPINNLLNSAINHFKNCDNTPFKGLRKICLIKKIMNERAIMKLSNKLINDINPHRKKNPLQYGPKEFHLIKNIITPYIRRLDDRKLIFNQPFLGFFLNQGYLNVAEDFIEQSRVEDCQLSADEIFQAMRNVWIMNSLQIFWGINLEMTPSVYGYSMLYPYTDNYLDDPEIDEIDKISLNDHLTRVLNGEKIKANNKNETRIFNLVEYIESQYDRSSFPQVFQSIQLIHEAQISSLKQNQKAPLTQQELLSISFFKGGSSVLADAFLVKGKLTIEEMHFAFEYGVFLQFLDDLQDISVDKKNHHQTLFSMIQEDEMSDDYIRQLISYIHKVNSPQIDDSKSMTLIKEVIRSCTLVLIMEAVGKNPQIISKKLYCKLESYSKFRLSFYNKLELQLLKHLNN